jgi:hypothetical protein
MRKLAHARLSLTIVINLIIIISNSKHTELSHPQETLFIKSHHMEVKDCSRLLGCTSWHSILESHLVHLVNTIRPLVATILVLPLTSV